MLRINHTEIKAIFFDLDGTLINSEPIYNKFWREASASFGLTLTFEQALELRSLDTNLAGLLFEKWYGDYSLYKRVREVRREKMDNFVKDNPIPLKKSAIERLKYLKKVGIKAYIVTATRKEDAIRLTTDNGLYPYLEGIISTKQVKVGKPNPDVYLYALEVANLNHNEVLAVEDSPNGIMSVSNAKIKGIFVPDLTQPTKDLKPYIYKVFDSLADLKVFIENSVKQ